ncbi:MAG: ABC transporter substrate-binding protein [Clostridiales bacterium]|nr:ABC transporter substrate-binding protein [Clostridiales bacterium]
MRKTNLKKAVACGLLATMTATLMTGCGGGTSTEGGSGSTGGGSSKKDDGAGQVYFLNFKPEIADAYEAIAKEYTEATGVEVKVVTAASGTYEQTLKSEIAKADAPTIFQINGPVGYQNWKEYCADLTDTEFYGMLQDPEMAVKDGDAVKAIPYAVEGYGIIYNNAIMDKYFALEGKASSASSMDDINNFATLKEVVEDMQSHAADLGIEGVFASTSLSAGNQWRWQTHLANVPFQAEFADSGNDENVILAGLAMDKVEFKYNENFKNIFDLYTNNSLTEKGLLGSKSVDDSMAEFALGKCAMVQNGNWAWGQISEVEGNTVKEEDIKMLPIYIGLDGEEKQGLCVGTENYLAINSNASEADQKASLDFIQWLFSSPEGKAHVQNDLGFITPFNTFSDEEAPTDPLAKEVYNWNGKEGYKSVSWAFAAFPSENFKDIFGDALLQYVQGSMEWNDVVTTVQSAWETEKANSASAE